jgi:TPR repeat protein
VKSALVFALAACASAPKQAGSDRRASTPTSSEATTEDAGDVRACAADGKEVAPCVEDCDRGIASACAIVATRAERGDGVPRDLTRAVTLHERACDLRDALSCIAAAHMHSAGIGVSPNRARQMDLLATACKLGDATACSVPAKAYASGAGVPRDAKRARELWEHACAAGLEPACEAIADAGVP